MRKISHLFLLLLLLSACKKIDAPINTTKLQHNDAKMSTIGIMSSPEWNLLGYGYNVTGEYAKATSARGRVINIEALKNAYPTSVERDTSLSETSTTELGSNSIDISKGLSYKAGLDSAKVRAFKGSFSAFHLDSTYKSSKYLFAKFFLKKIQRRLYLIATTTMLQNYLDPGFASAIQSQTPAYIVQNYGTHIMADILLGGKLEALYEAESSSSDRRKASGGGLDISIGKIFGFSAGHTNYRSEATNNSSQKLNYTATGGTVSVETKTVSVDQNSTVIPVDISNWKNSVTPSSSTLIEFNKPYEGAQPLIPIYEVISDPVKRAAVKSYVDQYLINNRVKIDPENVYENYASNVTDHVFTLHPNENLEYAGWVHHGAVFKAFASQVPGTVPIFESYHDSWYMHYYSPNQYASSGWPGYVNNGVGWVKFYAHNTQVAGTVPVYQFYSNQRDYLYSTNSNFGASHPGWTSQGIAFYAYPN